MTILEFLVLLLVAGVCGAIGLAIGGSGRGGCLLSVGVGFIGAVLGTWLARTMDLPELFVVNVGGRQFPVLWAIIGGGLFALFLALITRGRSSR